MSTWGRVERLLRHSTALHKSAQGRGLTNPLLEAFSWEWGNFHSSTERHSGVGVVHVLSDTCLLLAAEAEPFLPAEVAEWPTLTDRVQVSAVCCVAGPHKPGPRPQRGCSSCQQSGTQLEESQLLWERSCC